MLVNGARATTEERVVEECRAFIGTGHLRIGETITAPAIRARFARLASLSPVTHWRLRNVSLEPTFALVFAEGEVLEQTRFVEFPWEEAVAKQGLIRGRINLHDKRFYMGFNRVYGNYFHWIAQCVPTIASYHDFPDFPCGEVLLRPLSQLQLRALQLAGIPLTSCTVITEPTAIDVADITYCSLLSNYTPSSFTPSSFSLAVFDRMAERALPNTPMTEAPRLIYVWRIDSPTRPMRNEDDLVDLLISYGIEPVILNGLRLDDQIALFRNARLIIGPHGAGLCNIVFCRPGAVLYELFPSHWVNPCMNQLAQARGLNYWCDAFRAEARPDLRQHKTPWQVNLNVIKRRLEAILSSYTV
jgi:hypothetical protein